MPAPVDDASAAADSEREADSSDGNTQSFSPRLAADGSVSTYWCSESGRKLSQWTVRSCVGLQRALLMLWGQMQECWGGGEVVAMIVVGTAAWPFCKA